MITAELTIIPIGTNETSLSEYIAAAVKALNNNSIKYELTGMGTIIETENLDEIFIALKAAHEAVFNACAERLATSIKIDERRDKNRKKMGNILK